jgi:hypothetical protein
MLLLYARGIRTVQTSCFGCNDSPMRAFVHSTQGCLCHCRCVAYSRRVHTHTHNDAVSIQTKTSQIVYISRRMIAAYWSLVQSRVDRQQSRQRTRLGVFCVFACMLQRRGQATLDGRKKKCSATTVETTFKGRRGGTRAYTLGYVT